MSAVVRDIPALKKRLLRLLRLDGGGSARSELSTRVFPALQHAGELALIGGAIRDVARDGVAAFRSDFDFVAYGRSKDSFANLMAELGGVPNRFGGYALKFPATKVDIWHIDDTWAKTTGLVDVSAPEDLLRCTFFDWDSVLFDVRTRQIIAPKNYLERLSSGVMDVCLRENPNPIGSLARALRRAALWHVSFGPRLTSFARDELSEIDWEELVELDTRAFAFPVLFQVDRASLIHQLSSPRFVGGVAVTQPVPRSAEQIDLPFQSEGTSLSPVMQSAA